LSKTKVRTNVKTNESDKNLFIIVDFLGLCNSY